VKRARGFTLVAAAAAAMLVTACGGAGSPKAGAATGDPYTIGFEGSLTGNDAAGAVSRLDGMRAYFDHLNKSGGVANHPINVVSRDDATIDAARATTNFLEFRDRVKPSAIAGWTNSTITDAVLPLDDQAQIPLLIGTGTEATLAHPYAYLVDTLFSQEADAEFGFMKAQLKAGDKPKLAILTPQSSAGKTLKTELDKLAGDAGYAIVLDEIVSVPFPPDLVPQANRVAQLKADWVLGGIALSLPISFMRTLAQLGWNGKVVNYRGGSGINYLQQVASPSYYVLRSYAYSTDAGSGIKTINDTVKAGGGDPNGDAVMGGWMTGALVAKALAACGFPCAGPAMKKALDGVGLFSAPDGSAFGQIGFSASDHEAIHGELIYVWKDGRPQSVGGAIKVTNGVKTPAS
jgi:branched-chain amino acid transport system substrate-binding protein